MLSIYFNFIVSCCIFQHNFFLFLIHLQSQLFITFNFFHHEHKKKHRMIHDYEIYLMMHFQQKICNIRGILFHLTRTPYATHSAWFENFQNPSHKRIFVNYILLKSSTNENQHPAVWKAHSQETCFHLIKSSNSGLRHSNPPFFQDSGEIQLISVQEYFLELISDYLKFTS